jgi:hypothetical protein
MKKLIFAFRNFAKAPKNLKATLIYKREMRIFTYPINKAFQDINVKIA